VKRERKFEKEEVIREISAKLSEEINLRKRDKERRRSKKRSSLREEVGK